MTNEDLAGASKVGGCVSAEFIEVMRAVFRELEEEHGRDDGNAPGHGHSIPGVWDRDNGPELAGKPCAWCALWAKGKAMLAAKDSSHEPG